METKYMIKLLHFKMPKKTEFTNENTDITDDDQISVTKTKKNNWKFHHQLIEIAKLLSISKYIEQIGFDLIDKCIHA